MADFQSFSRKLDERKRYTDEGVEYWMARELRPILGYDTWQKFTNVIDRAVEACRNIGVNPEYHFSDAARVITAGKGAQLQSRDLFVTRYACYLIAMNGDAARKPEIAMAQSYFAIQTRRQEKFDELTEDQKRIALREQVRDHNKHLSAAAQKAGVANYPGFHDAGYRGMYGGLGVTAVKIKKGIPRKENVLDRVCRTELAAHDFRITQTEEQLDGVMGEEKATALHYSVGQEVRSAIQNIGGKMPEDLPAEPHIKTLLKARKKAKQLPPASV
jgi:DNA-damage-inducible protein D